MRRELGSQGNTYAFYVSIAFALCYIVHVQVHSEERSMRFSLGCIASYVICSTL